MAMVAPRRVGPHPAVKEEAVEVADAVDVAVVVVVETTTVVTDRDCVAATKGVRRALREIRPK